MNNKQKYKQYEEKMDAAGNDFCRSFFPDGIPSKIFSIGVNFSKYEYGFFLQEAETKSTIYHFKGDMRKPYYEKRPSSKQVESIKIISEMLPSFSFDKSDVCLRVKNGSSGWGVHLKDFDEKKASFDRSEMEDVLNDKIEHYKNNFLVGANQFACSYCRKATDNSKKVTKDIISRQYPNYRKAFDYCSLKCASYDQMAHEG